ncbi:MAG TPA: O-antigen ligase family protein [Mycobacteriales bacterium]|nr:O-antigen ligase family protein [Mycobacteriales bacterium]
MPGGKELAGPLLLAGMAAGLTGQGGYAGRARVIMAMLVAAATVAGLVNSRAGRSRGWRPPSSAAWAIPVGLLAGWAVIDGALHGEMWAALPTLLLLAGVVAVVHCARGLSHDGRQVLTGGMVALGVGVAAAGWLGVALHIGRWGLPAQDLWRASSTLTYPNATAAVLAPLGLLVLAWLTEAPRSIPLGMAATALLIGLGATGSRAGLLATMVGVVLLATLRGLKLTVRSAVGPLLGAAIALAGLLPSAPTGATSRPALALAALLAGLVVGTVLPRLPGRAAVLAVGAAGASVVGIVGAAGPAIKALAGARATLASPDRVDALRAALRLLAGSPLTGTGPGHATLQWAGPDGAVASIRYVHNEYLQVAAEYGAVGAVLLAAVLVAVGALLRAAPRDRSPAWLSAGVIAGAGAFATHSAFDFLWHLPALPLTLAALLGLAAPTIHPVDPAIPTPCE